MSGDLSIARPYAEASYAHAFEQGRIDAWAHALELLDGLVATGQFADAMRRPGVGAHTLFELAQGALGGGLEEDFARFLRLVVENRRLDQAPAIRRRFLELKLEGESVVKALVRTAFPLEDRELSTLEAQLVQRSGARRIEFEVRVDPSLIGGARVQMGDDVIELSMRSQLAALAHSIRH